MLRAERKDNAETQSTRRFAEREREREENKVGERLRNRARCSWAALMTTGLTAAVMAAAMCVTRVEAQEKRPTAQEVIAAIQEHVGVPWKAETVDTFKAGNPETRVTGIAGT